MPVFMEDLEFVIRPSVMSIEAAVEAYREAGGSASIFVNDDGLQLLGEAARMRRIQFYRQHNIGYLARPPHDKRPGGFQRRGRFKKASNMNFCLSVAKRVAAVIKEQGLDPFDALEAVRQATADATPDEAFLGGGDVRVGEFILLVDSDTRIPQDCILPTVSELLDSAEVAFTQHLITPMQVSHDYFENAMAFFTTAIYIAIKHVVAAGDVAPLVGHNAFLRWAAIEECAFVDAADGRVKFWSESHVSEDFDMSVRLQIRGYIGRYISYTGAGFQEGLSLTIHDEVTRYCKYAYGCSEMLFNPVRQWLRCGVFSKLFISYIRLRNIPWYTKVSTMAYMGTYFALAMSWPFTLLNCFLAKYSEAFVRAFQTNMEITYAVVFIFGVLGPLATSVLWYRTQYMSLRKALLVNFGYTLTFGLFFNCLSWHLWWAIAAHLLGLSTTSWGATNKEVKQTNFFQELRFMLYTYRSVYILFGLIIPLAFVIMSGVVPFVPIPHAMIMRNAYLLVPVGILCFGHTMGPILLSPPLMLVKF
ncbi:hypothetical protein WJX75_009087 [Coccomyxa subellipsoidea]|uniref:Glycosyltransferase 2-like domain-containing protein n=1 Tax=Coccomyxa subellipsoidea TaxID=248742 RepID=A0ABR2Z537_9CHLO